MYTYITLDLHYLQSKISGGQYSNIVDTIIITQRKTENGMVNPISSFRERLDINVHLKVQLLQGNTYNQLYSRSLSFSLSLSFFRVANRCRQNFSYLFSLFFLCLLEARTSISGFCRVLYCVLNFLIAKIPAFKVKCPHFHENPSLFIAHIYT